MAKAKKTISLAQISAEDKAALLAALKAEEEAKITAQKADREKYKQLVNQTIPELFIGLAQVSELMKVTKQHVYEKLNDLITLKAIAYSREDDQVTHSFTTDQGVTIIIGHRENDGWDDTANTGIAKVNDCLSRYISDDKSKALVKTIKKLLSKDAKGNLKPSRIMQLYNLAEEMQDADLLDAVKIIQEAYRPALSKKFLTVKYRKQDSNEQVELPLSMTDV